MLTSTVGYVTVGMKLIVSLLERIDVKVGSVPNPLVFLSYDLETLANGVVLHEVLNTMCPEHRQ